MDKRRKELLFLGAGLAVLLLAIYFTFKPSTPRAQATTQAPAAPAGTEAAAPDQAEASSESAAASAQASVQIEAAPAPDITGGISAKSGRNPFAPLIAAAPRLRPGSTPPAPPIRLAMMPPPELPVIRPMPLPFGSGAGMAPLSGQPTAGLITPTRGGAPADDQLRLTGVIYGDPSVAIIRQGQQRFFVHPGDYVAGRYVVKSISQRRVVLASSEGTLSLDLTGRL